MTHQAMRSLAVEDQEQLEPCLRATTGQYQQQGNRVCKTFREIRPCIFSGKDGGLIRPLGPRRRGGNQSDDEQGNLQKNALPFLSMHGNNPVSGLVNSHGPS